MIRNEAEYKQAVQRVAEEAARIKRERATLKERDLSNEEIKRALDPVRSFHEQLKEEIASSERLMRGEFDELRNFEGVGRLLIAVRIAKGVSQRELADRLGVHESQVSRDERNEYHGVTVERANRILETLGVELRSSVEAIDGVPA
jgi:ribosome-binding protein aMBF1 (putative translation factor)